MSEPPVFVHDSAEGTRDECVRAFARGRPVAHEGRPGLDPFRVDGDPARYRLSLVGTGRGTFRFAVFHDTEGDAK